MMMGAANLMMIGAKQTEVASPPLERNETGKTSFAMSFGEGMQIDAASLSGTSLEGVSAGAPALLTANKGQLVLQPGGKSPGGAAGLKESLNVGKTLVAEANGAERKQDGAKAAGGTVASAVGTAEESSAGESSLPETAETPSSATLPDFLTVPPVADTSVRPGSPVIANAVVAAPASVAPAAAIAPQAIDNGKDVVATKKKALAEKTEETASAKKTGKSATSVGKPEVLQRMPGLVVTAATNGAGATLSTAGQSNVVAVRSPDATADGGGKTESGDRGRADFAVSPALTASAVPSHGSVGVSGEATNTKSAGAAADAAPLPGDAANLPNSPKQNVETEKAAFSSAPAIDESVGKSQGGVAGSFAAVTHALGAMGSAVSAGTVAVGGAPAHQGVAGVVSKPQTELSAGHGAASQPGGEELNAFGEAGAASGGAPHMLMTSPTALEVGIQNGTHGWLKVRAEITDGGGVSASVATATPAAQEMLHRELPALTAYLQQEKIAVSAVVVHPAMAAGTDLRNSTTEMGGGQAQQRGSEGGQRQQAAGTGIPRIKEAAGYAGLDAIGDEVVRPEASGLAGGGWLSVRA